jgi:hypothetical protein
VPTSPGTPAHWPCSSSLSCSKWQICMRITNIIIKRTVTPTA